MKTHASARLTVAVTACGFSKVAKISATHPRVGLEQVRARLKTQARAMVDDG